MIASISKILLLFLLRFCFYNLWFTELNELDCLGIVWLIFYVYNEISSWFASQNEQNPTEVNRICHMVLKSRWMIVPLLGGSYYACLQAFETLHAETRDSIPRLIWDWMPRGFRTGVGALTSGFYLFIWIGLITFVCILVHVCSYIEDLCASKDPVEQKALGEATNIAQEIKEAENEIKQEAAKANRDYQLIQVLESRIERLVSAKEGCMKTYEAAKTQREKKRASTQKSIGDGKLGLKHMFPDIRNLLPVFGLRIGSTTQELSERTGTRRTGKTTARGKSPAGRQSSEPDSNAPYTCEKCDRILTRGYVELGRCRICKNLPR